MTIIYTHTWRQSSLRSRQISWLWEPIATARQRRATFASVHLHLEHWALLATAGHHHTLDPVHCHHPSSDTWFLLLRPVNRTGRISVTPVISIAYLHIYTFVEQKNRYVNTVSKSTNAVSQSTHSVSRIVFSSTHQLLYHWLFIETSRFVVPSPPMKSVLWLKRNIPYRPWHSILSSLASSFGWDTFHPVVLTHFILSSIHILSQLTLILLSRHVFPIILIQFVISLRHT